MGITPGEKIDVFYGLIDIAYVQQVDPANINIAFYITIHLPHTQNKKQEQLNQHRPSHPPSATDTNPPPQ